MSFFDGLPPAFSTECLFLADLLTRPWHIDKKAVHYAKRYTYLDALDLIHLDLLPNGLAYRVSLSPKGELYLSKITIDPLNNLAISPTCAKHLPLLLWYSLDVRSRDLILWMRPWLHLGIVIKDPHIRLSPRGHKLLSLMIEQNPSKLLRNTESLISTSVPAHLVKNIPFQNWGEILPLIPEKVASYYASLIRTHQNQNLKIEKWIL